MRLTNESKSKIKSKVMEKAFKGQEEALQKKLNKAGDKIYKKVYNLKERKAMESLPNSFFKRKNYFKVELRGKTTEVELSDKKPFGYDDQRNYYQIAILDGNCPVTLAFEKLTEEQKKLKEEKAKYHTKLNTLMLSCNTVKQLTDKWPESKEYTKGVVATSGTAVVPVSLINDINSKLENSKHEK